MKKLTRNTKIIIVVVTSILILLVSGGIGYVVYANYQKELANCNAMLAEYQTKGIDISSKDCKRESKTVIEVSLAEQESNLKKQIAETEEINKTLEEELTLLNIKYEAGADSSNEVNLATILNSLQERKKELEEKRIEGLKKLEAEIIDYEKLLSDNNKTQNFKTYSEFIDNYKKLDDNKKIATYADFNKQKAALAKEIEETKKINAVVQQTATTTITPIDEDKYKTFSASGFVDLYYSLRPLPNTKSIDKSPSITGNADADKHIVSLAEARGYRLQSEVTTTLSSIGSQQLQSEAKQAYLAMVNDASKSGFYITIVSGFRDIDTQRTLFLSRFRNASVNLIGREYTSDEIINGQADQALDNVLKTSSIPGYSRHHTGMTFDIGKSGYDFTRFKYTNEFTWMSANNYL
ncbi:D-alanyl-D-alanine carboxypeptidase family protein, partial [Candidatus Dojkabacteria bacterium]|nr:D-alanyl-D-alanine carboxypeptidase family protein [Candidatus Dojkabacteria bacterium]